MRLYINDYGSGCTFSQWFPRTYNLRLVDHGRPDQAWLFGGLGPHLNSALPEHWDFQQVFHPLTPKSSSINQLVTLRLF